MTDSTQALSNLVEAGWQALADGEVDKAESASEAALRHDSDSIDALSLAAALAVAMGEIERSLELCMKGIAIDPEDPRLYIQAAEAKLYSERFQDAIDFALKAVDTAGDEADFVDAVLIKAEAEMSLERGDEAERTMSELDACSVDEAPLLFRIGQVWLELGDATRAKKFFTDCLRDEPDSADAHHGLGLACDELGDDSGMLAAWRSVRELDASQPPPSWHLKTSDFKDVVENVIRNLPASARDKLADIALAIAETPPSELVEDGFDPRALSLFEGEPAEDGKEPTRPSRILVYQNNLERACQSRDQLDEEIRLAVLQETADFFSLDDDELEALALG